MKKDDSITITLATVSSGTGFPTGAQITEVTFYGVTTTGGVDTKGTSIGTTWKRSKPASDPTGSGWVSVGASGNGVVLTDTDSNSDSDNKIFFGLTVEKSGDSNSPWTPDPELILKKAADNAGFAAEAAG